MTQLLYIVDVPTKRILLFCITFLQRIPPPDTPPPGFALLVLFSSFSLGPHTGTFVQLSYLKPSGMYICRWHILTNTITG